MSNKISREGLGEKYSEFKERFNRIPTKKEFLEFVGVHSRELEKLYGSRAYSRFQVDQGDEANVFGQERMSEEIYLREYGNLAKELGNLPKQADWTYKGLKPSIEGLAKRPHFIKWSEMPARFREWVLIEKIEGYSEVLSWIQSLPVVKKPSPKTSDRDFESLITDIRQWSPARRRNTEESYKVELRMHLKSKGYSVNEEYGESDIDLLVSKKFAIEIKKAPSLAEYDRLFGQIARHLQHGECVIALIMDVPREDQYRNFMSLVDDYLNKESKFVEVMKK